MTVLDMILKVTVKVAALAVTPTESSLDAINEAVRHLALKLADRNSDLARGNYSKITSRQTASLPDDFNGFYGKPHADGVHLEQVPAEYDTSTPAGAPKYYDVVDDTLYLYPTPLAAITITAQYWSLPDALTNKDAVPYSGRFDSLLLNMATKIAVSGFSVLSQQAFLLEVEQGLDSVLFPRRPALPTNRPFRSF